MSSPDYYFASGQIDAKGEDAFMRESWFRRYLIAAKLPSISCGEPKEVYRVLWLPSSRNAKIITISRVDGYWTLDSVDFGEQLYGGMSDIPPPLKRSAQRLSDSELDRIREEFVAIDFWSAPQYKNGGADDGTALVIEGRSTDRYRVITRLNEWDGAERVACVTFSIANLRFPDHPRCPEPVIVPPR